MTTNTPTTPDELSAAIAAMMQSVTAAMQQAGEQLARAMEEWKASPSGQYMLAVVDYYERHPEELEAMIAARRAEAAVRYCDCMCGRWNHRGACQTYAETERLFALDGDPVTVPLCSSCARSIDEQRPVPAR